MAYLSNRIIYTIIDRIRFSRGFSYSAHNYLTCISKTNYCEPVRFAWKYSFSALDYLTKIFDNFVNFLNQHAAPDPLALSSRTPSRDPGFFKLFSKLQIVAVAIDQDLVVEGKGREVIQGPVGQ